MSFCKTKWPETDVSMCEYIEQHVNDHGMDKTIKDCTREGFNLSFYEASGVEYGKIINNRHGYL